MPTTLSLLHFLKASTNYKLTWAIPEVHRERMQSVFVAICSMSSAPQSETQWCGIGLWHSCKTVTP